MQAFANFVLVSKMLPVMSLSEFYKVVEDIIPNSKPEDYEQIFTTGKEEWHEKAKELKTLRAEKE